MEFWRLLGVVLILDCSSREEHELLKSDKSVLISKQHEYHFARVWRHVCIPFFRESNAVSPLTDFSVDSSSDRTSTPFRLRIFTLTEHSSDSQLPPQWTLHSIANTIDFHNFWTHKSDRRFEHFLTRIWEGLESSIVSDSDYSSWRFCDLPQYLKKNTDI
jgi:hypothetical protein